MAAEKYELPEGMIHVSLASNENTGRLVNLRKITNAIRHTSNFVERDKLVTALLAEFEALDFSMANNGHLPLQWVTKENQIQLGYDRIHADPEELKSLRIDCGHVQYRETGHCRAAKCYNFIGNLTTQPKQ